MHLSINISSKMNDLISLEQNPREDKICVDLMARVTWATTRRHKVNTFVEIAALFTKGC